MERLSKRNLVSYTTKAIQQNLFDTQEPVTSDEAISVAKQIGALGYFETSAKENQGVYELFSEAAKIAFVVPKSWIQQQLLGDNAEKDKDSDFKIHTLRTNTEWRHIITQANNLLLSGDRSSFIFSP